MPEILDTTLRDGSYVVDFQIDRDFTYNVAKELDEAGFPYIETGHGLGLNATTFDGMKGKCSDEEWMDATSSAVKKNKWGMFFIPGIGRKEDIDLAARYNMDFIRIGANVDEYHKAEPFVKHAKELGMFVCANFMKSYALEYNEFGKVSGEAAKMGCDLLCIVDSAGAMLPEDLEGYVKAIRQHSDAKTGFHGHNNLGMANINSLVAHNLKVDVIDTSLRGMGRSAGNTVTEIFLLTLLRKGIDLDYDIYKIMDISEKYIDPIMKGYVQVDSNSIISGYSKFHSSFTPRLEKYASLHKVDIRKLMVEICKETCINAPEDLIEKIALMLKK